MMASSCCDTQTIFLNNDHSRTALPGMNFQQQYNNYGTERRSDPDAKTCRQHRNFRHFEHSNFPDWKRHGFPAFWKKVLFKRN